MDNKESNLISRVTVCIWNNFNRIVLIILEHLCFGNIFGLFF